MHIAVYCASSPAKNPAHTQAAQELGTWIGRNRHTLVYGGCKTGLMGVVAQAALDAGASVVGVVPDIPTIQKKVMEGLTEYVQVKDLAERKQVMIHRADTFVALPGGLGTIDEIADILALIRLHQVPSGCAFINTEGFYDPFATMLDNVMEAGYMDQHDKDLILFTDNIKELGNFLSAK